MLTYNLEHSSKTALYEQLYEFIKADIQTGSIKSGEKLPSKRMLASHLQISLITVENAYAQLNTEGYIYSEQRKGYYVSDTDFFEHAAGYRPEKIEIIQPEKEYIADFVSNAIDTNGFPFSIWSRLARRALSDYRNDILKASPFEGLKVLREAIAQHLYQFRGLKIDDDNIFIGSGTEHLYNLLIQLLGTEYTFAVEDPGYDKPFLVYKSNKIKCVHIPVKQQGIDIDALKKSGADIAHVTPSHHFPTGVVMPVPRRYELLNWARQKESRYIIEDDYDSEFAMSKRPIPCLHGMDKFDKVIYMNTFSKTISPSVRISYMILPPKMADRFKKQLYFYSNTVAVSEQKTLSAFILEGYFEKHINRMKKIYKIKRDEIIKHIKHVYIPKSYEILEEDSGLHFILKLNTKQKKTYVLTQAEQAGIKLSCVSDYAFHDKQEYENRYVINYSGVEVQNAKKAVEILGEIAGLLK